MTNVLPLAPMLAPIANALVDEGWFNFGLETVCGERCEHDVLEGRGVLREANHPILASRSLPICSHQRAQLGDCIDKPESTDGSVGVGGG